MKEDHPAKTDFLPSGRASESTVSSQHSKVADAPFTRDFLNIIPNITLILNRERQIVFCNEQITRLLKIENLDYFLGMRPGEAFNCIHSRETEGGCGTTKFCRNCGAALAILSTQKDGKSAMKECRINREEDGKKESLDLRVWSSKVEIEGESFLIFSVQDISDEKRRKVLEKIFFHDIRNTAGNILSFSRLMKKKGTSDKGTKYVSRSLSLSEQLLSEIEAQQILVYAENNELKLTLSSFNSRDILESISMSFESNSRDVSVTIDPLSEDVEIVTDRTILNRVLTNMVKNGVEASEKGGSVTVSSGPVSGSVRFRVHNSSFISETVQEQIFQRSFSTKGENRGLGTYSMQLLSENYLKGRVWFSSRQDSGTDFFAEYPCNIEKQLTENSEL